ncbi:YitT family protein [Pseudomonas sp. s4]|uniref:YitT family protein n=1 Tax=Pseudomonas sp. s4 TaxID=353218 RepID=UPI00398C8F7B
MPFYYLAVRRMSWSFSLKTFAAIAMVSLMSAHSQNFITLERIDTWYAALIGNMLMGIGYLVLFRHRASLGGFGILMLYLQDKFGWRAGWLQMGTDVIIVCISLTLLTFPVWVFSVIGAVTLNMIVALNHRADRYLA